MDKNDLYNAFDKIDPALVTRSEEGNCFAKKKAKRSFAEKGRGRMIIPLIIVPLAVIAAIAAISVISYNNRAPGDKTLTGPESNTSIISPMETPGEVIEKPVNIRFLTDTGFTSSRKINELSPDFSDAYASISLELLGNIYETGSPSVISPMSIITSVGLTACGARGKTQDTIFNWLGTENDIDVLNDQLYSFRERFENGSVPVFSEANGVFLTERDDFIVNNEFLDLVKNTFRAQIAQLDFGNAAAADALNKWINDSTNGMVPALFKNGDVNYNTVMVLANSVCFDAEWDEPFTASWKYNFHGSSGDKKVKVMASSEHLFIDGSNETGFIKTYKGGQFGFAALLPREGIIIEDYVKGLEGNTFTNLIKEAESLEKVDIVVPSFSVDTSLDLRKLLKKIGLEELFSEDADFGGFGHMDDGSGVGLGKILHGTKLEVFETGTRAGSSSVVTVTAAATEAPGVKKVILDRPFVFSIIDMDTGLPLFIGVYDC